jgi:hypothetical protein
MPAADVPWARSLGSCPPRLRTLWVNPMDQVSFRSGRSNDSIAFKTPELASEAFRRYTRWTAAEFAQQTPVRGLPGEKLIGIAGHILFRSELELVDSSHRLIVPSEHRSTAILVSPASETVRGAESKFIVRRSNQFPCP